MSDLETHRTKVNELCINHNTNNQNLTNLQELYEQLCTKRNEYNLLLNDRNQSANFTRELDHCIQAKAAEIRRLLEFMLPMRKQLVENYRDTIALCGFIQNNVLSYLAAWKNHEERIRHGFCSNWSVTLEELQSWFEKLATVEYNLICNIRELKEKQNNFGDYNFSQPENELIDENENNIQALFDNLMRSALVIEQQPTELVKQKSNIQTSVRLLTGNFHNYRQEKLKVIAYIKSEGQAAAIHDTAMVEESSTVKLLNNKALLTYDEKSAKYKAEYKNLNIPSRPKNKEKKGESVLDEKQYLLFTTKITIGHGENRLEYDIFTFSLPIVIKVHNSQEESGRATLFWDSIFIGGNRLQPYQTPLDAPKYLFDAAVSSKFEGVCGRALTPEQLNLLYLKFGKYDQPETITWSEFCKTKLPGHDFTFWEWFYDTFTVCREYLKDMWRDGLIVGFITKPDLESKLSVHAPGTFMIRFSDSEPGTVAIGYVNLSNQIEYIAIEKEKLKNQRCLAGCILDLAVLRFLYPAIPKEGLTKYYKEIETKEKKKNAASVPINPYRRVVTAVKMEGDNSNTAPINLQPSTSSPMNGNPMLGTGVSPQCTTQYATAQELFDDPLYNSSPEGADEEMPDVSRLSVNSPQSPPMDIDVLLPFEEILDMEEYYNIRQELNGIN